MITEYAGKRLVSGLTDAEASFHRPSESSVGRSGPGHAQWFQGRHFKQGQVVTFKYRELTSDGIPKRPATGGGGKRSNRHDTANWTEHFTDADEAYKLVLSLTERLDPAHARRYIEPSCGKGAFVEALRAVGVPRLDASAP